MAGGSGSRAIRELIEERIAAGASLEEIEDELLAGAPMSEELRDALWLYAWGCLERRRDAQRPRAAA